MNSDLQHILDLCSLYYQASPTPSLRSSQSPSLPTAKLRKLNLTPYTCCSETFSELSHTLVHFFESHFPVIKGGHVKMRKTPHICVIGNKNVPVIQRAAAFLKLFNTLPSNPRYFRPAPHSQSPLDFKNPYTSATALAYDFMEIVNQNPLEYSKFTFMLSAYISISDHHDTWPYWAYYIYPSLLKPSIIPKNILPERPLLPAPYSSSISLNPTEEELPSLKATTINKEFNPNELACPFKPCTKVYTSVPGFRAHMLKHHLQKKHFKADLTSKPDNLVFICPTRRCSLEFKAVDDLRLHILKVHFSTYSKKSN
ncbi:hypothetical protein DSO57_1024968 [Entomophthora muscae]|uniref:Uncharacterized protein n=1 Tax=Entomophthora muscae TaxID=34485 RepID=A0ACC2RTJ2_9FUNG|nr:hypothetical protein DSO57_1024968 [Entomophthora muscae]